MAATFTRDCPHCNTLNCSMTYMSHYMEVLDPTITMVFTLFRCNACKYPSTVYYLTETRRKADPQSMSADLKYQTGVDFKIAWPQKAPLSIPGHLPEVVSRNFIQAKECLAKKDFEEAACMSYRRTLELALKIFDEEIGKAKLVNRIDKIFEKGLISPPMREWAHEIREFGNDGNHDMDTPDREDIEQMAMFTEQLLIQLFTMPKEVEMARAKRNAAH